ncbi:uncharacterized protein N7473_007580 [Penicillium subrubescens]|uniref:Uncharacterized protein n=1 Tax=Penicillium subrubescens TaxID=1316194 RepID=A0A1Q5UAM1_9EURO|nr:uncharacterized protein N7473_007580 [Penicillium subrubescens]KAJ5891352.1 hypothetical protein N7473_007580 [Penicillium subrubescens]OKP09517.1 hypothetical protein PENSUB_5139 [Penicillium subrubescens]
MLHSTINQQGQVEFSWKVIGNELLHPLCTRESPFDDAATSRSLHPNPGADSSQSYVDKASSIINFDSLLYMPCQTLPCGAQNQASSPSATFLEITDPHTNDGSKACLPSISELDRQFRQFVRGIRKDHDFPYIHQRLLYFSSKEAKRRNGHVNESYRTYSQFWLAKKNRASVRMVICSVPQGTYTWGAALIKSQDGREANLLIYECDFVRWTQTSRKENKLPLSNQQAFWKQAQKNGATALWYHEYQPKHGVRSVMKAVAWIRRMITFGDERLADNDQRLKRFKRLV